MGNDYPLPPAIITAQQTAAQFKPHESTSTYASTAATANLIHYWPVQILGPYEFTKFFWVNGTAVAGNVDCGVYTRAGGLIASTGSTAQSGTSTLQIVTLGSTVRLTPGWYNLAIVWSSASGTMWSNTVNARDLRMVGSTSQSSTFPLPSSATFATPTHTTFPMFGMADSSLL